MQDLRSPSLFQLVQLVFALFQSPLQIVSLLAHTLQLDDLLISLHADALYLLCPFVEIFRCGAYACAG